MLVEGNSLVLPADIEPFVRAFAAAHSQWRWASLGFIGPMGGVLEPVRVGLDYAGVRAAWSLAGIVPTPELFESLQLMEAEALIAMAELRRE
jgi:hypothetical protein